MIPHRKCYKNINNWRLIIFVALGLLRWKMEWNNDWLEGEWWVTLMSWGTFKSRTRLLLEFTKEFVLTCVYVVSFWTHDCSNSNTHKNIKMSFFTSVFIYSQINFTLLLFHTSYHLFWLLSSWAAEFPLLYQICQQLNYSKAVANSGLKRNVWPFFVHQFFPSW